MNHRRRILVIGGGFTGLTAAQRLSKEHDVVLVEGGADLGGLAGGCELLGTNIEKTYHHLFQTDTAMLDLIRELGLEDRLIWCKSSMAILLGGRIYPFMSPLDLLRFTPCGILGRLRFGLVTLYLQRKKRWQSLARQTAFDWMTRACGRDVMRTIWGPLLRGKFDRYYKVVSMAWLWARIHIRANSRKGPGGGEQLAYIRGGFAEVVKSLEKRLVQQQVQILKQTRVDRLELGPERHAVLANGKTVPFDYCLYTGPSFSFAELLPNSRSGDEYARKLKSIDYLGAICLVFASDQSIARQYWLNIHEENAPFLVFLEHTQLTGTDLYQGKHVYYIGTYQPRDSQLFSLDDSALRAKWFAYLKHIYPHFDEQQICWWRVFRFNTAQHVVDTGYQERIPGHRTPFPGVYLANFSQIFPEDRGTNFAVRDGIKVAEMILGDLNQR